MTIEISDNDYIVFERRHGEKKLIVKSREGNIFTFSRDGRCPIIFDEDEIDELIEWIELVKK